YPQQHYTLTQAVSEASVPVVQATYAGLSADEARDIPTPPRAAVPVPERSFAFKRVRITFLVLVALALVALIIDTVLASAVFTRLNHPSKLPETFPLLTITPNRVNPGQLIQLHLGNFLAAS